MARERPHEVPPLSIALAAVLVALVVIAAVVSFTSPGSSQARAEEPRWTERIEVAQGEGHRGPWRMNRSDFRYVDDPTVAMRDGVAYVAWVEQARKDIFLQVYGPDGQPRLEQPVDVSRTPEVFSWLPRVVVSADGREVYVLWQEIVFSGGTHGGEIFFTRSTDGGRSFGAPLNLSNTTNGAGKGRLTRERWDNGSLDLARGPDGTLYAAWTEYQGALRVSRSTDGGQSFGSPVRVSGTFERPARGPSLAVGDDAVLLAWTVGQARDADIHLARSTDGGGSFSRPRVVHRTRGHGDAPKIAVDDDGVLHLAWAESRSGPRGSYGVRYARSRDGGRSFERPRAIARRWSDDLVGMSFPALELDERGHVYLVFETHPDGTGRSRGLGFTSSRDGGDRFAAPSVVPGTVNEDLGVNGSQQGQLMDKLGVDDRGNLAVVNSRFSPRRHSHVFLILGRARP